MENRQYVKPLNDCRDSADNIVTGGETASETNKIFGLVFE